MDQSGEVAELVQRDGGYVVEEAPFAKGIARGHGVVVVLVEDDVCILDVDMARRYDLSPFVRASNGRT